MLLKDLIRVCPKEGRRMTILSHDLAKTPYSRRLQSGLTIQISKTKILKTSQTASLPPGQRGHDKGRPLTGTASHSVAVPAPRRGQVRPTRDQVLGPQCIRPSAAPVPSPRRPLSNVAVPAPPRGQVRPTRNQVLGPQCIRPSTASVPSPGRPLDDVVVPAPPSGDRYARRATKF